MKDMNKLIVLYKLYHIDKYVTNGEIIDFFHDLCHS